MSWRTSGSEEGRSLPSSLPLLRDHKSARRRQQYHRDQPFSLQVKGSLTHLLQVRAGVVHQDESERRNLRQVAAHFLLANGHITVAEEQIDSAVNCHLHARLVA